MFGIGFSEILIIAVIAVVFVGPKRLPELMKQFGRFFVHARRMSNEVRSTFDSVVQQAEHEIHLENLKKIKEMTQGALTHPMLEPKPVDPAHDAGFEAHQHGSEPMAGSVAHSPDPSEGPGNFGAPERTDHSKNS